MPQRSPQRPRHGKDQPDLPCWSSRARRQTRDPNARRRRPPGRPRQPPTRSPRPEAYVERSPDPHLQPAPHQPVPPWSPRCSPTPIYASRPDPVQRSDRNDDLPATMQGWPAMACGCEGQAAPPNTSADVTLETEIGRRAWMTMSVVADGCRSRDGQCDGGPKHHVVDGDEAEPTWHEIIPANVERSWSSLVGQ